MPKVELNGTEKQELLEYLESCAAKITNKEHKEVQSKLRKKVLHLIKKKNLPNFVVKMVSQIKDLLSLIDCEELSDQERDLAVAALHYFIVAEDKVPDYIPVVGYIDDAFIISVVHGKFTKQIGRIKTERECDE